MRLVYCLTTIPSRLKFILPIIDSVLSQTRKPDQVYLTIPLKDRKQRPFDSNDLKNLEQHLKTHPYGHLVKLLRPVTDWGPIMKILAVLTEETDPETRMLIGDDDRIVLPKTVQMYENSAIKYPNAALSISGWSYGSFPFYFQCIHDQSQDKEVDWLQGTDGILIKRDWLNLEQVTNYQQVPLEYQRLFMNQDDHWIAYHLHKQQGEINKKMQQDYKQYLNNIKK